MKQKAVIVDLDSTLFDIDHRLPFILDGDKKDWEAFRDPVNMEKDGLIKPVYDIVVGLSHQGYAILILTGRSDISALSTWNQLVKFKVNITMLYMRNHGDKRKSAVVKQEIYEQYIMDNYDVKIVLDDHPEVISMFREVHGLYVMRVQTSKYSYEGEGEVKH